MAIQPYAAPQKAIANPEVHEIQTINDSTSGEITQAFRPILEELPPPDQKIITPHLEGYQASNLPYYPCSCVSYARWYSGINVGPIGYAMYHPVNSDVPTVGALVVFMASRNSPFGHLASVTAFTDSTITITESNHIPCAVGTRTISRFQTNIKGYYK